MVNPSKTSHEFIIDGINYGPLVKKLEKRALFHNYQCWEDMINSICIAMSDLKDKIKEASQQIEIKRYSYQELAADRPTDIYWIYSILMAIRTVGILYSKSTYPGSERSDENKMAHQQLLDRYVSIFQELYERRQELLALYPH